jgi:hypothetical protein
LIIREDDYKKLPSLNEAQIKHAHEVLNQWDEVQKTMNSRGWQILAAYFKGDLQAYNSVTNCTETQFKYRQGLCEGLARLTQTPDKLKKLATSAIEALKAGLAETEE